MTALPLAGGAPGDSLPADLPRGRMGIDSFNGHLLRLAGGQPCPRYRLVHDLVRRRERERVLPAVAVLAPA